MTSVGTRLRPDFAHSWFGLRATVRSVSNVFGLSRGNILAQSTAILTSNGNQYYDLPLSFTLLAGNLYDLSFEITEIPPNTGVELTEWFGFYQVFAMGNNPSFTVGGVIRVLDGGQFTLPNPHPSTGYDGYNFLPQHRLNAPIVTVPEPGTYALLASGLAAVAVVARRRRSR
ncbi:MAG: PEP-CTERM sorting domain-containing protein [Gemmatimonadaceae bacterium]|nr:PEP-CTERM sorting domain-containing protein [Gemmatimonadaceae bacterium]